MIASKQDSLQRLLSCVVCLEEFEEDGDHTPRLLPCTHTLCEASVNRLIHNQQLECPECREKHKAKNKEKSFPQNKYLLVQVKRKPTEVRNQEAKPKEKELCEEHGKELVLFCKETECQKPICLSCLRKKHKNHNVTDIEGEQGEALMTKIICYEK